MDNFDIPIFKKGYDLYKTFHEYRKLVPKADRYTVFERGENTILDVLDNIMTASGQQGREKLNTLNKASSRLNLLRVFTRLLKDTKIIDLKKYISLENIIDEIGRMLGGWIKSIKVI
ncbi:MAG: diversity-generating retroelement protein Avd [Patescibacteria group bacterium]|jgi:four helix bundle protein